MKNILFIMLILGSKSLSAMDALNEFIIGQKYPPIEYYNCYQPQADRWTQGPRKSGLGNSSIYVRALEFMMKAKIHLVNMLGGYALEVTPVSRPGSTIVFAYKKNNNSNCVGFVAFRKTALEGVVEITHIAVEPYFWQQGIGAMLLQSITVDSAIPT